jgi:chromosomal replication initiator protein
VTQIELDKTWKTILEGLSADPSVTPALYGFATLIEPRGVMAGTIYLEVPNDFTRSMIEQRLRGPLFGAIGSLGADSEVSSFAIVVNSELADKMLERVENEEPAASIPAARREHS